MTYEKEKGFTLVELAIVMTIIGLLIGGILKGQELMENARVTATIAQVKAYEAAVTTFRDTYSAIPGDMKNADTRIPGCDAACAIVDVNDGGNSIVGTAGQLDAAQSPTDLTMTTSEPDKETVLFWVEMGLADLISGVTSSIVENPASPTFAWGETHPAAKIGGGFHVRHGNGTVASLVNETANTAGFPLVNGVVSVPSGLHLVLTNAAGDSSGGAAADFNAGMDGGALPISPNRAAQIDRKMDDGEASRGFVRGMGAGTAGNTVAGASGECFFGDAMDTNYNEQSTQKDCSLLFRIQG